MKDVKPIFKDHTGRWREQNPKKDQKFFCDSWNQVAKCAPGQNCDCREYEQFEQSIQYHEFPNPPEVKPGEVVLAY
ncbi:MAG TPA: hypothetical protein VL443_27885 [Cyclobacteriaceae bacterium]|nr:hypothetical protein [Cyclobacteriaceae bacterium]